MKKELVERLMALALGSYGQLRAGFVQGLINDPDLGQWASQACIPILEVRTEEPAVTAVTVRRGPGRPKGSTSQALDLSRRLVSEVTKKLVKSTLEALRSSTKPGEFVNSQDLVKTLSNPTTGTWESCKKILMEEGLMERLGRYQYRLTAKGRSAKLQEAA